MMQLTMVASFLVLLCLFGTIAATTNGARDDNAMTSHEVIPSKYINWSNASCYNDPAVVKLLLYPSAVHNTRKVGEYLAKYLESIIDTCHVPLKNITLMGHSLGAHISGFAAKHLQKSGYGKIPLLIGTDPAAPLFIWRIWYCKDRFCKTDAERVVALHTSALGLQISLGHLDLWFNNGLSQPKCGGLIIGSLKVNCSHNIAIEYLAITLKDDCVFIGIPISSRKSPIPNPVPGCSSDKTNCVVMDDKLFDPSDTLEGNYCASVSSEYPYCTKKNDSCKK
ncbi:PREDICTED: phospholipase A1-like isoform X2 [Wasmannia auropunctata]|uniref:phospholipase A1-like isoform X2 n=1 Tax=Wasmannia auropunctata TaxID=64793 RepID=UPI0005F08B18|nr:PREDICTED: phospholipase A1-like isoform X2 [Wasmannia auropunctata]